MFPWSPVLFAIGIGAYFALKAEPTPIVWGGCAMLWLTLVILVARYRLLVLIALALMIGGFGLAGVRAWSVADIKLSGRYYGPIEGRIVAIDRSQSDAVRLTLDHVVLFNRAPDRTPGRIRVALHGTQGFIVPEPGLTVMTTGHLSPPGGPVEPGGYDFRRQAWFQGLGAVGYTRNPVVALKPHSGRDISLAVYRMRMRLSRGIREGVPGRAGGFAAAILTGDRSAIDRDTRDNLRRTNLAHLLAISGLHMAMLTGVVFVGLRGALSLIPGVALRIRTKKFAAVAALLVGAGYLVLSGGSVATERAFVMISVMYVAVLADRRAITLRSVALAAMIVLAMRPEVLAGPGFQMSFAATTALVVCYNGMKRIGWDTWRLPMGLSQVAGVAVSSLIAGSATAPIAAAHFNMVPHYGLVANIAAVPLMGILIMPSAVGAALLWPIGLEDVPLALMGVGIEWILIVADFVSAWPNAASLVAAPLPGVLPVICGGAVLLALWRGAGQVLGGVAVVGALAVWTISPRPDLLVSESGSLVGVLTDAGRAMSKPKGDSFAASVWLENDGDAALQDQAAARKGFRTEGRLRVLKVGETTVLHGTGKTAAAEVLDQCGSQNIAIINVALAVIDGSPHPDCIVYDQQRLRQTGSLAISLEKGQVITTTAQSVSGRRLWSQ